MIPKGFRGHRFETAHAFKKRPTTFSFRALQLKNIVNLGVKIFRTCLRILVGFNLVA